MTITEYTRTDEALHRQLEELRVLHAIATAGAEATDVDQFIERATQVIGETFYPDNFGLMLLDDTRQALHHHPSYHRGSGEKPDFDVSLDRGITGFVARTGRSYRIADVRDDPVYLEVDRRTLSELCVPLKVGERVIGVVNAESAQLDDFTEADERLLTTLAGQLAIAIDRLKAESIERCRADKLAVLYQASQEIVASLEPRQIFVAVHRAASQLMPVDAFVITLLDESAQEIDPVYLVDRGQELAAERIPVHHGLSGHVIASGKAISIADYDQIEGIDVQWVGEPDQTRAILAVPITWGGKVFGMLSAQSYEPMAYSQDDLKSLGMLANQLAIALSNARLFEETQHRLDEVSFLGQIIAITATEKDLPSALKRVCAELVHFFRAPEAGVALFNSQHTAAHVIAEYVLPGRPSGLGVLIPLVGDPALDLVLESKSPLVVADVQSDPLLSHIRDILKQRGVVSLLIVPVTLADEIIGILLIDDIKPRQFTQAEIALVQKAGSQIGQVLERLGLFAATQEQAELMAELASLSEALNRPLTMVEVIKAVGEGALKLGRAQQAALYLKEGNARFSCPWAQDLSDHYLEKATAHIQEMLVSKKIKSTDPVLINDIYTFSRGFALRDLSADEGSKSVGLWPLVYQDDVMAVIGCYYDRRHYWSDAEQEVMLAFARQAAVALQNARLFEGTNQLLEKIKAHALQVQQIMDSVPDGVLLLDTNQHVVLANPAAHEHLSILNGLDDRAPLTYLGDTSLEDVLDAAKTGAWIEVQSQNPGGKVYELAVQPLEAGVEESGGWVLVLRDVTQERESQNRIQMQERLATVGQLAAGIAHDFNNILAAIVVYADLLKRDPNLPAASRERLAIIHEQVQRAASLIRQILDFSRRSVLEQSTLDVLPFLKEMDKLLRRVLPETIQVELRYQPGSYQVIGDPTRLQQVFMNLAVNARDAMPDGGLLHFEIEKLAVLPDSPFSANLQTGNWVRISIRDTGIGISQDALAHVFEPFYTTKPVGQGTGLGLAQAYGIIKQHGGHIEVQSCLGQGTIFNIFLPALEPADDEDFSSEQTLELEGDGEMILVVEDDAVARQAMCDLLEAYNYHVLVASNGLEALKNYSQHGEKVALVVSDIVMPEMGGVDLYYSLQEQWPQVKMLFVTGHPLRERDQDLLERGDVHWLQKPYSIQSFHETIQYLIRESN